MRLVKIESDERSFGVLSSRHSESWRDLVIVVTIFCCQSDATMNDDGEEALAQLLVFEQSFADLTDKFLAPSHWGRLFVERFEMASIALSHIRFTL